MSLMKRIATLVSVYYDEDVMNMFFEMVEMIMEIGDGDDSRERKIDDGDDLENFEMCLIIQHSERLFQKKKPLNGSVKC
ncbi:hypothetical protein QVD17_06811 [Tagetes erecta]|uniref:Uncharacterized protein n=1 Tax=Tagetes erecta TaxID=13708 RepID=A0AAD8LEB0_TARER|nr:hypothetical protein QVD17_06811 [Tagetes erecta]